MDRAREAVGMAPTNLRSETDEAALFTFDSTLRKWSTSRRTCALRPLNLEGKPWGITSLYDAIGEAARRVARAANKHRALLVITDGVDTGSQLTAPRYRDRQLDRRAGLPAGGRQPARSSRGRIRGASGDERRAAGALADLARWTGGDCASPACPGIVEAAQTS